MLNTKFTLFATSLIFAVWSAHASAVPLPMPMKALTNGGFPPYFTRTQAIMNSDANTANTARSGEIAIREEFDAALQGGNVEGLEMFILRHPNHPLALKAREHLAEMRENQR